MPFQSPCPACGRKVARTLAGRVRAHNDGRCDCPVKRKCRGGAEPFPCTYKTDGILCVTKLYPPRQLQLFE